MKEIYFQVNPLIPAHVVHHGGRQFRKGIVYDAAEERIPEGRLKKMLGLKMGKMNFFVLSLKESTKEQSALRAE